MGGVEGEGVKVGGADVEGVDGVVEEMEVEEGVE